MVTHDTDKWSDYDEGNVPFKRLQKVYVPDDDSLEQRMNIFHGQLYSLYRDNRKFRGHFVLPLFDSHSRHARGGLSGGGTITSYSRLSINPSSC